MTSTKPKSRKVAWVVLGVVGAALVIVVAFLTEPVWEWVAYRRVVHRWKDFEIPVLQKRASWLPGNEQIIAAHKCLKCTLGQHLECHGDNPWKSWVASPRGRPRIDIPQGWDECTCQHPFHRSLVACNECRLSYHQLCRDSNCECADVAQHTRRPARREVPR